MPDGWALKTGADGSTPSWALRRQESLGSAGRGEELRCHHPTTQVVGPAGGDSAEQCIDQPLEDGVAHAWADHLADGQVAVGQGGVGSPVAGQSFEGLRGQDAVGDGGRVEGDAEYVRRGQGAKGPVQPDRGRPCVWRHEFVGQAQFRAQVECPRHPDEEGVGGLVDGESGEGAGPDPAARSGARLEDEQGEFGVVAQQAVGGSQSGDPRTDDDYAAPGHAQFPGRWAWTRSTMCSRTAGSVSGSTPCPRLKT